LVVRCGAFGDMVLVTPLIRDLSARFGGPVDVLTSGPWSEPLLRGQPGVGDVVTVRSRKTPYWLSRDQQRAVRWLRARGAGPTWCCDGNEAARPMLSRAGVPEQFIVDSRDHPLLAGEHATEQWRRLAQILPAAGVSMPVSAATTAAGGVLISVSAAAAPAASTSERGGASLEVSASQLVDLDTWWRVRQLPDAPFVAIQVGNKRTMRRGLRRLAENTKYWPNDRWAVVLRHIRARLPAHAIVMLGTGPEYQLNQEIIALTGVDGIYNVADDLPVPRLTALLSRARGLITVDSGPAHAAAAVGCPLVVLFGKASTRLYRPWGRAGADVKVLTGRVNGEANMLGITTEEVVAAWDALALRAG
jgi:ADP-heptose:LPS heptosyltransferase